MQFYIVLKACYVMVKRRCITYKYVQERTRTSLPMITVNAIAVLFLSTAQHSTGQQI